MIRPMEIERDEVRQELPDDHRPRAASADVDVDVDVREDRPPVPPSYLAEDDDRLGSEYYIG